MSRFFKKGDLIEFVMTEEGVIDKYFTETKGSNSNKVHDLIKNSYRKNRAKEDSEVIYIHYDGKLQGYRLEEEGKNIAIVLSDGPIDDFGHVMRNDPHRFDIDYFDSDWYEVLFNGIRCMMKDLNMMMLRKKVKKINT